MQGIKSCCYQNKTWKNIHCVHYSKHIYYLANRYKIYENNSDHLNKNNVRSLSSHSFHALYNRKEAILT